MSEPQILDETKEYIRKIDEVERDRLSRESSVVQTEVEVHDSESSSQAAEEYAYTLESKALEEAGREVTPEEYYEQNGYNDPPIKKETYVVEKGIILTEEQVNAKVDEETEWAPTGVALAVKGGNILEKSDLGEDSTKDEERSEYNYETASLRGGPLAEQVTAETYYRQNGYDSASSSDNEAEVEVTTIQRREVDPSDEQADRISSLHVYIGDDDDKLERLGQLEHVEEAHEEASEAVFGSTEVVDGSSVAAVRKDSSSSSSSNDEDKIASLHEVIDVPQTPVAQRRSSKQDVPQTPVLQRRSSKQDVPPTPVLSRRSSKKVSTSSINGDYDEKVKMKISQYKEDKGKSNMDVLRSIEQEEGGDNPDVKRILAWAKGYKKKASDTMVVRQKAHEYKIRRAVDVDALDIVISNKSPEPKQEEPVKSSSSRRSSVRNSSTSASKVRQQDVSVVLSTEYSREILDKLFPETSGITVSSVRRAVAEDGCKIALVDADLDGERKEFVWRLYDKANPKYQKEVDIHSSLAPQLKSLVPVPRPKMANNIKLPLLEPIFEDEKVLILDATGYKSCPEGKFDEAHMKVAMVALAQLHAISHVFFARTENSSLIKNFLDRRYLVTETGEERHLRKAVLEMELDNIANNMEQAGAKKDEVEKVRSMKSSIFNIYGKATTYLGLLPALCQGQPTTHSFLFSYNSEGQPIGVKIVELQATRYCSGFTDLHIFLHTVSQNASKEDFLLRFVYYETIVATLKALGSKATFTFDDMKAEFQNMKQFGYIESCRLLLNTGATANPTPRLAGVATKAAKPAQGGGTVSSKILGKFFLKPKVAETSMTKEVIAIQGDVRSRIRDLMEAAGKQ